MKDFSFNLSTWAYQLGYRLQGGTGTYDELELYKENVLVRRWDWLDKVPNILELEEVINGIEEGSN